MASTNYSQKPKKSHKMRIQNLNSCKNSFRKCTNILILFLTAATTITTTSTFSFPKSLKQAFQLSKKEPASINEQYEVSVKVNPDPTNSPNRVYPGRFQFFFRRDYG